ncbi:FAD-dependent oxidoreductase [Nocardia implantans]|uniref:FAD-dependent oxidoreductase n=1 Tax=Nocardia implantans TaxID=3108168 RepID=A0ABU6AU84_9NOCA|nr:MULTISPECIES: FAD-dependent oxidoreductase [unclassified Nocardia]MEA3532957.1 FAD-dependent oxidoreductase [Nocardia sp. CDC192]MEB3510979.1 FAD-dependent oxidoreductase [Nocardia sp. CDC186]
MTSRTSALLFDESFPDWDEQVGIGGGAFAYLAPGQHARYLAEIGAPRPYPAPRVFFAGEHLSVAHAWIQGALQSALESVRHVLDQVSVRLDRATWVLASVSAVWGAIRKSPTQE